MNLPLHRLRTELANATVKITQPSHNELATKDVNIQFTFNGFSALTGYRNHLREFYDQFKIDLEEILKNATLPNDQAELLESIQVQLIESEKLDGSLSINDSYLESNPLNAGMEEAVKYRFTKK